MCIKNCNGMIITSFQKSLEKYDPMEIKAYNKYKKIFKSTASSSIKGNIIIIHYVAKAC